MNTAALEALLRKLLENLEKQNAKEAHTASTAPAKTAEEKPQL